MSLRLSILLESYCNWEWYKRDDLSLFFFQFSWSLIATLLKNSNKNPAKSLSILLESYCNCEEPDNCAWQGPCFQFSWSLIATQKMENSIKQQHLLSILLESYCNDLRGSSSCVNQRAFNSPGVLLQLIRHVFWTGWCEWLSILLESYCNAENRFPSKFFKADFQFSWSLIATWPNLCVIVQLCAFQFSWSLIATVENNERDHHNANAFNSPGVLLQPPTPSVPEHLKQTFNSPGVLLQLGWSPTKTNKFPSFQFSWSLIATP